jgi:hypothetical protein
MSHVMSSHQVSGLVRRGDSRGDRARHSSIALLCPRLLVHSDKLPQGVESARALGSQGGGCVRHNGEAEHEIHATARKQGSSFTRTDTSPAAQRLFSVPSRPGARSFQL